MAARVPTRLVSFGKRPRRYRAGDLEVVVLRPRRHLLDSPVNPVSERLLGELRRGDVVHTHHYETLLTNACLLAGRAMRKPVFVTDLGGGTANLNRRLGLHRLVTGALAISRFAAEFYPELMPRTTVISGGVDTELYSPADVPRERQVVYVGRLYPFKGVDVLIEAVDADTPLHVYGRRYDEAYSQELERLAAGKRVTFHADATDEEIRDAYRRSMVAVLPSVYRSRYDPVVQQKPELLGLTLLEAMACGTPAICSDAGAMPEVIDDGETGYVVPPSDPAALGERIRELLDGGERWRRMSGAAAERVREGYTWDRVAERCLEAYSLRSGR